MTTDEDKLAAVEAAANELKKIRYREKALDNADSEATKLAIGGGIQSAVEAGDMAWGDLKNILKKHVASKEERALLKLDDM